MARKRKKKHVQTTRVLATRHRNYRIAKRRLVRPPTLALIRPKPFLRDEQAIYVRTPSSAKVPTRAPLAVRETPKKLYVGFQRAERVTSCDQKRERRRRAFFGYLNAPHAGKGAAIKVVLSCLRARIDVRVAAWVKSYSIFGCINCAKRLQALSIKTLSNRVKRASRYWRRRTRNSP